MGKIMKHQGSRFKFVVASLLSAVLFSISSPMVMAQEDTPEFIDFRIQTVKMDQVARWQGLRKEMSETLKEAGVPFYHVFQRVRGPLTTYVTVSPAGTIGEPAMTFGEQPELNIPAHWIDAMWSTLESQTLITLRTYPDLATNPDAGHPGENFVHVRILTAAMGKNADLEAWLRDDIVPALREAGAGDVRIAQVVLGGSPRSWSIWSFVPGWPEPQLDLDPQMIAKAGELVATQTDYFFRLMEDLSFTAE